MAGALKGIVVEIGGDTTKLGQSLKGVEKQTRTLQNELRGVNTLLKMDPSNTSLLAQKQQLLSKSVNETKNKLNQLKDAQKQIDSGQVKATEEQYRDLEREIAATEQQLKKLEKEQQRFGSVAAQKVEAAGAKFKAFGQGAKEAGQKLAPVSAAFAAVGGASISAAYDLEKSLSKVQALSGASADDMAVLEQKAREMGSSTVYSATDAADAFGYMALAGWNTGQMVEGINPILNLAAASQMDLGEASDIVTDYLTAFGLEAKDAGKFVDQMAYAQAHSNTNTSQLAEAYKQCAATASSMGFSVEDTTAVLMNMGNAGVKGGEAGTALSAIMTRLGTDTKGCASLLEKHGVAVYDSEGKMNSLSSILTGVSGVWENLSDKEKANLAKTIAGTNHYSKFATIMEGLGDKAKKSGQSFEDYSKALEDCDGASQDMADTMTDNLYGQVESLKSALGEAGISIGQALLPAIKEVTGAIKGLIDWFNALPEEAKQATAIGVVIGAALAPVLMIIGAVASGIGSILSLAGTIVGTIGRVVGFIFGTLIPGIGSVVGAISAAGAWPLVIVALVVAAIATLYATCEPFREFVNGLISGIVGFLQGLVASIVDFFTVQIPATLNAFLAFIGGIPGAVGSFIQSVGNWFAQLPGKVGSAIGSAIGSVGKFALKLVSVVATEVPKFISGVFTWFSQLPGKIWSAIVGAISRLNTWCGNLLTTAKSGISKVVSNVFTWFAQLPGKVASAIAAAPGKIASMLTSMLSKAKSGIESVAKALVDGIKEIPSKFGDIGKNIIEGLWKGIGDKVDWLLKQVEGVGGKIVDKVKDVLHIKSPSRRMRDEVGKYIPEGIGVGIEMNAKTALEPMEALADEIVGVEFPTTIERDIQANFANSSTADMGLSGRMAEVVALLGELRDKGQTIVMDSGELVGSIIGDVDRQLGTRARLAERGF